MVVRMSLAWSGIIVVLVNLPGLLCQRHSEEPVVYPRVQTEYGMLQGTYYRTIHRRVVAFLGVPYAEPPTDGRRFMPPEERSPWQGIRYATANAPECIQLNLIHPKERGGVEVGKEDCLYMDIYAPFSRLSDDAQPEFGFKLPVIVNFHGGSFSVGKYEPRYILDNINAVFVTVNYRVGPFGFLTTESQKYPGNMGLKDQVMALQWIQRNIGVFNGDPNRVTLVGWSAGAASVHFHYLSDKSRNLFQRGISMSGSAFCPWALMENGKEKTLRLGNALGCGSAEDAEVVTCLKDKDAKKILRVVTEEFMPWLFNPFSPFGPTVERPSYTSDGPKPDPFLVENPYEIVRYGKAKPAPWLVSVVADEGLYPGGQFITNSSCLLELEQNWEDIAPHLLDYNYTLHSVSFEYIAQTIRNKYLDLLKPMDCTDDHIERAVQKQILDMLGDRLFTSYIGLAAQMHAKISDVYFYKFSYRGQKSVSMYATNTLSDLGVCHGDDVIYTLGSFFEYEDLSDVDKLVVAQMMNIWENFVIIGNPGENIIALPAFQKVKSDIGFGQLNYMNISTPQQSKMVDLEEDFGRINFWKSLNFDELSNLK